MNKGGILLMNINSAESFLAKHTKVRIMASLQALFLRKPYEPSLSEFMNTFKIFIKSE